MELEQELGSEFVLVLAKAIVLVLVWYGIGNYIKDNKETINPW